MDTIPEAAFNGAEDRVITLKLRPQEQKVKGSDYLESLPV
tara:strand:- start:351 stop:470 length:120 start_codon:yes stop_codon:yes gene_type:complete